MIQFNDWEISDDCSQSIARQYDNLSHTLTVAGGIPEGWDWAMLVEYKDQPVNVIALLPVEGGIGVTLKADMIPYAGYYRMQLRGTQGEAVRHTNIIQVYIQESLTGEGQWPDLPSEFEQIEERMLELAGEAQNSATAAKTSAGQASQSAQNAEDAATAARSAQKAAETAEGKAVSLAAEAAGSARAAQGSATEADKSADSASGSAKAAKTAAQDAQKARQAIEDMTATIETLEPDAEAAVVKTVSPEGVVNLKFGIPKGMQGEKGNVLFATFDIDPETGILSATYPDGYSGPIFTLNNDGHLEVEISA